MRLRPLPIPCPSSKIIGSDPRFRKAGEDFVAVDNNTSKEEQREENMERIK